MCTLLFDRDSLENVIKNSTLLQNYGLQYKPQQQIRLKFIKYITITQINTIPDTLGIPKAFYLHVRIELIT